MNFLISLLLMLSFDPGQSQAPSSPLRPTTPGQAAEPPPVTSASPATAPLGPPPATYNLGPQDVVRIAVSEDPDIGDKSYTIDANGDISFMYLGRVAASGLTVRQLQDKIAAGLADGFIRNPIVRVDIEKYKSQFVQVLGEVRTPGRIPMMGTKTLLEALGDAGSPTSNASLEIEVTHTRRPDGTPLTSGGADDNKQIVDLKDLLAAQAFILRDGDIVTVPKNQTLYINGEVKSQGILVWQRGMTLTVAVTLAGGLTDRGTYRGAKATRIVKGKTVEVDLNQQSLVMPDDVINIKKRLF